MKKLIFIALIATLAVPAMAGITIRMTNPSGPGYLATVKTNDSGYNLPASFITFCVEGEPNPAFFNPGTTYVATIDDVIMFEGASAAGPLVAPKNETKMLYSSFLNGEITTDIQNMIWRFEAGTQTTSDISYVAKLSDTAGWKNVKVLNLWQFVDDGQGGTTKIDIQSQLVRVPAPGAVLLGGLGVACVGWIKRRRML